jgi:hypothetical protein
MGTYFLFYCKEKNEYIDSWSIGMSGRFMAIENGAFAHIVAYAVMEKWNGCNIVVPGDDGDAYDIYKEKGNDITRGCLETMLARMDKESECYKALEAHKDSDPYQELYDEEGWRPAWYKRRK